MQSTNFEPWLVLLAKQFAAPIQNQPEDIQDRLKYPPWQAKKWAIKIFDRVFSIYREVDEPRERDDPNSSQTILEQLEWDFSIRFKQNYTSGLLQLIMSQALSFLPGVYVHPRVKVLTVQFLIQA